MATEAAISILRRLTGAGLMDCAEALKAHPNIFDAAEHLRTKGQAVVVRGPLPSCGSHTCTVGKKKRWLS